MRIARRSRSREVGYTYEGTFNENKVDRLLSEALTSHVISQYVAKMYSEIGVIWFNGSPGAKLRELRKKIKELLGSS